jgi:hypothetical protein
MHYPTAAKTAATQAQQRDVERPSQRDLRRLGDKSRCDPGQCPRCQFRRAADDCGYPPREPRRFQPPHRCSQYFPIRF